ncbi:hypothetical protein [Phytoactinopolyspora mesophila]|uniref:VWA domain-containing protein n=1 Tax=Phytoactinopolyspora mesophila TaxID=2650750 RepID=A0A7K3LY63_9ACTN|nr:hypothetical protein [Phytoactinopolyspora mesophila]NDL55612.1 hypothetical protein [Phytoactinopolyspora mesophila]
MCSPAPCEVAAGLADDGIDLTINTVGFALEDNDQAREELNCIAEVARGEFRDVESASELTETLEEITARERRRVEFTGSALEGAPIPQNARTGDLDTTYTDVVLPGELNYYRFEVNGSDRTAGYRHPWISSRE